MKEANCVVVGAGFAGAATAWQLTRRGMRDVVVVEKESNAGLHSSGRNAAMIRQVVPDDKILPLAIEGAAFIRAAQTLWRAPGLLQTHGSLLLASGKLWKEEQRRAETARQGGVQVDLVTRDEVERRVDATRGGDFDGAVFTASDGVVDAHELLHSYIREARTNGAEFLFDAEVSELLTNDTQHVAGVRTTHLDIAAPRVVNAAGAWATSVASGSGAMAVPLDPYRRHLVFTGAYPRVDRNAPFVWDLNHDVYFRPESGGILLSPCDEQRCAPCTPQTSPEALELLAEKLEVAFPELLEIPVMRTWAGLRVFAPDRRFVIGEDPCLAGLFWVAGLGGHGVTTSAAVGSLAAEVILESGSKRAHDFRPSRFAER